MQDNEASRSYGGGGLPPPIPGLAPAPGTGGVGKMLYPSMNPNAMGARPDQE